MRKEAQEKNASIWRDMANHLLKSRQRRVVVNLSRLNRHTQARDTAIVPGKVLGTGKIDHPINVAAYAFSEQAKSKILEAKGKCLTFEELIKKNPTGTNVKIIG